MFARKILNFCAKNEIIFDQFSSFIPPYLPTILKMYFFVYAMVGINIS